MANKHSPLNEGASTKRWQTVGTIALSGFVGLIVGSQCSFFARYNEQPLSERLAVVEARLDGITQQINNASLNHTGEKNIDSYPASTSDVSEAIDGMLERMIGQLDGDGATKVEDELKTND